MARRGDHMAEMDVADHGAHVKVAIKGRLDSAGVGQLEERFIANVGRSGKPALIDFSGVTFLSSMGIRLLVSAAKDLSRRGLKMVLLSPQALVRESITSAALQRLIPLADSDEEAAGLLGTR